MKSEGGPMLFERISRFILTHPMLSSGSGLDELNSLLQTFLAENKLASTSPNYANQNVQDDIHSLLQLLQEKIMVKHSAICSAIFDVLTILFRKKCNRLSIERAGVEIIVKILRNPAHIDVVISGANTCLNMCFEKVNVQNLILANGVIVLLSSLSISNSELQINCAGALQSVSYQRTGRKHLQDLGCVTAIAKLLHAIDNNTLKGKLVGVLHNVSSDISCVTEIREQDLLKVIISMISSTSAKLRFSAIGVLQNCSRERQSKDVILKLKGAVEAIVSMLFSQNLDCQAMVTGTLLNLIGPDVNGTGENAKKKLESRAQFKEILGSCISLGAINSALFD